MYTLSLALVQKVGPVSARFPIGRIKPQSDLKLQLSGVPVAFDPQYISSSSVNVGSARIERFSYIVA